MRLRAGFWRKRAPALAMLGLIACGSVFLWRRSTFIDPRPTTSVLDRHGQFIGQIGWNEPGYGYWPVDTVPHRVEAAILALEDRRFWDHPGIDPLAVLRAMRANYSSSHRVSGASTLAMQVARMQRPSARGYGAKITEMVTALLMTARYGRSGVLEQYLRLVPFGQSTHGIAHAARWYFDKPVEDLSWAEIAFLSAIPQAPAAMNPKIERGRERAVERGQQALARLRDQGVLRPDEFQQAMDDIGHLTPSRHPPRPASTLHALLRIQSILASQPPVERIRSMIDLAIEARATKDARERLDAMREQGAQQLAVMVIDPVSADVLAVVGSGRYAQADHGMVDYTVRPRSPGSTLKPFIYAQALERGDIVPNTILIDDADNGTGIDNADRRFLGPLLPRQALGNSRNVPAALLVRLSGLAQTHWFLGNLALHDNTNAAELYGLTLAVGGMPTRLDWLVTAYGALADDGMLKPLRWYEGEALPESRRVVRAETARQITTFLADPMARLPSFARMSAVEYPFPVAIKTGTSQGYRDAWAVAYSDKYLIGVWVGRPDGRQMTGLSGATSAAMVAHDILLDLQVQESDGQNDSDFRLPKGWLPHPVCAETGKPDDGHCDTVLSEFAPSAPAKTMISAFPPPSQAARPIHLRIATPHKNETFIRNPELPPGLAFLPLRVGPDSGLKQIVWYLDDHPLQIASVEDTVQWLIQPGHHRVEARSPFGEIRSAPIDFEIK